MRHADIDAKEAKAHGFDPTDYVGPADVVALLGEAWLIEDQERPCKITAGAGAHHNHGR